MAWRALFRIFLTAVLFSLLLPKSHGLLMIPSTFLRAETAPIRLWPGKHSYSWEASVDSATGIATSREVSNLSPTKSILHQQWQKLVLGQDDADIWLSIIERLSEYPQYLASGRVTLGLFRAVPIEGGGVSFQDRFFGIPFLTFGEPRTERFSIQKQIPSVRGSVYPWTTIRVGDCSVTIPMKGGLLTNEKEKQSAIASKSDKNYGLLRFEIKHHGEFNETQIKTEIQEYTPAIVGKKEPVPLFRKIAYLMTQSIVHAYVMWRFHKYCAALECDLSQKDDPGSRGPTNTVRIVKF